MDDCDLTGISAFGLVCHLSGSFSRGFLQLHAEKGLSFTHTCQLCSLPYFRDCALFVSDGAPWIWNRLSALQDALKLDGQNVHFLIDFYHAVEHLNKVASLRKDWSAKIRKRWLNKQRHSLHQGGIDQVIEAIQKLCRGRNSKAIRTQLDYFLKHRPHMNYAIISGKNLPIGSGAMESAIRRVVNLRLKGPSLFWCKPNADAMLLLRSFCKSGRWSLFKSLTFSSSHAFAS